MKKFDPFNWSPVEIGKEFEAPKGSLRVMCSDPEAAVYVGAEGHEALAGVGTEVSIQTAQQLTFRVEARKGSKAFIERTVTMSLDGPPKEVFTNADRMPHESGSVMEVRAEMRKFLLAAKQERREMRNERMRDRRSERIIETDPPKVEVADPPKDEEPEGGEE